MGLMTAGECALAFCRCWFEQRDAEGAIALLADDVCFTSSGEGAHAAGRAQVGACIRAEVRALQAPFSCAPTVAHDQKLAEHIRSLSVELTLKNTLCARRLSVCLNLAREDGGHPWQIKSLHLAAPSAVASACVDSTARKQAQEEVLRLYNNIPGAVFRCRNGGGFPIIDANDGLFEFLGYSRAEFASIGNQMARVIHPDDLEGLSERLEAQRLHGDTVHNECRLIRRDGTIRWISIKVQFFVEDQEEYLYCVFVDITEEKLLRERVRELYEGEMAYFAELSCAEGSLQGSFNLTQDRLENYLCTADAAVARVGDTYEAFPQAGGVRRGYGRRGGDSPHPHSVEAVLRLCRG